MAWEDMRRRLEEEKRRRLFFWWRPGCGLVLLGLIALLTAVVFIYDPLNWLNKASKSELSQTELRENGSPISDTSQKVNPGSTADSANEIPGSKGKTFHDTINIHSSTVSENSESIDKIKITSPQSRNVDPKTK